MSQRDSGYERKERDLYETPEWVTLALIPHLPPCRNIWEPACGSGKMARVLPNVSYATDLVTDYEEGDDGHDFLKTKTAPAPVPRFECTGIVTNPPYELATEFCNHALYLMRQVDGVVAMLLRTDFDHAKTRAHLFSDCPAFAKKLVLRKRIMWFEPEPGKKASSPSFNHAWYIWDWKHVGPPTIAYGP